MPEFSQMNEKVLRWYIGSLLRRVAYHVGNKVAINAVNLTLEELEDFVKANHGEPISEKGMKRFAKDGRNAKL